MVTKEQILDEIRRTAAENGGKPLGTGRFYKETGIKRADWLGKYWPRWGDAVREAGFDANSFQPAYDKDFLLDKLVALIRYLGHFPVDAELKMEARRDAALPNSTTFFARFGSKAQLVSAVVEYCRVRGGLDDVLAICSSLPLPDRKQPTGVASDAESFGDVYLLKSGRYYKIGRSNAVGRRERELAIQLPEKAALIHTIKTDDPEGIERYWHQRFGDRRKNGEWFDLNPADVAAFRRRKFQ